MISCRMVKTRASSKSGFDLDPLLPENLAKTVSKLSGPGFAKLRYILSSHFGARFQSTGDAPDSAETRIILQTQGASPSNPCLVYLDQLILTPFTGAGQFDLVERNANDIDVFDEEGALVSGGESEVIIATKSGFTDGDTTNNWSRLVKAVTVNKIYSVIFVPGDTGDGIYSLRAQSLNPPEDL